MRLNSTILLFLFILCALSGCHSRSYVRNAEQTLVRMISYDDYKVRQQDPNDPMSEIRLPDQPELIPEGSDAAANRALGGDYGIGKLIGVAADTVEAWVRKEAEKHQQQYKNTVYASEFWSAGKPNYCAFEVIRSTDGWAEPGRYASHLIVALEYSRSDPRIVLMRPVYFQLNAAKARVASSGIDDYRLHYKINTLISGAWIDEKGTFTQQDLANATFELKNYDLDKNNVLKASYKHPTWTGDLKDMTSGYFFAPPPSLDTLKLRSNAIKQKQAQMADKSEAEVANALKSDTDAFRKAYSGGTFRLSAIVTETDASKAQEGLIKIADYVKDNKAEWAKTLEEATK